MRDTVKSREGHYKSSDGHYLKIVSIVVEISEIHY